MKKKTARTFFITSFQGGIGKTFISAEFARALHKKTGRPVALVEFNMLRPSGIASLNGIDFSGKNTFLDYYKSNWAVLTGKALPRLFAHSNGVYYIPFSAVKDSESLQPGFQLNESDLSDAFNHFVSLIDELDGYIVVDALFQLSPLPVYMLSRADIIMYLYSSQAPYSAYTKQFEREIELRCELKKKLLWLKNYAQPDDKAEQDELKPVHKLPIANTSKEKEKFDESIDSLLGRLLQKEAQGGATVFGIQERETLTSDIIDYRKRKQQEVIADLEKRFGLSDVELREIVEKRIDAALENDPPPPSAGVNAVFEIKKFLVDEILGLGPLEDFMRDDDVDEIMVNGPDKIFIEKHGRLQLTVRQFANEQHVRTVIERILRPVGRTVNEKTPYVDARLLDGSRVHAIIPPLSLSGPMITIRKFSRVPYTMDDLVFRFKSATSEVAEFLKLCVHMKKNIVVSGGASSGKTTLLNVLSNFIYPTERVICIEDSAELKLNQVNLGRLESRQQGTEAKNQVTIRDLVRNALRMRPDRIIIGECRGGEAIDMLQAMNTGHDGSLTTLHANTPRDAVARLETMVLMGGVDLPLRAIREQIASSVNIIVQNGRLADGKRRILEIVEVTGIKDNIIQTQTIFKFEKKWIGNDGRVVGDILPTGIIPEFIQNMSADIREKYSGLFQVIETTAEESAEDAPEVHSKKHKTEKAKGKAK